MPKNGELLWQYMRWLPEGINTMLYGKRAFAIYGERIYLATSDAHVVALDVKTGELVWDTAVGDLDKALNMTGGPLVAKGKIMVGTSGGAPGGNYIVGLDAATGEGRVALQYHRQARTAGRRFLGRPAPGRAHGCIIVDTG